MKQCLSLLLLCFATVALAQEGIDYVENSGDLNLKMVYVEGGTFAMGNDRHKLREVDEENVHEVELSDFYIGSTEVTVAQFASFVNATGYKTDAEVKGGSYIWDDEHAVMVYKKGVNWRCNETGDAIVESDYAYFPVVYVSWNDAVRFCEWLVTQTGVNYRLPTEAEWEYAARGGVESKGYVYSGSNKAQKVAWYWDDSTQQTHPVSYKLPNELGIYDMSGNVYEWCHDWYEDHYPTEKQVNPQGPTNEHQKLFRRVIRGGSWVVLKGFCRVSNRDSGAPNLGTSTSGFRIACSK